MCKYSLVSLSVMLACGTCFAEEQTLTMLSPSDVSQELTLINGDRLLSSRYAAIITPVEDSITLTFEGVNETVLPAKLSLDSVQFSDDTQFVTFLKNAGVRERYIRQIVKQNETAGFAHSKECYGSRSECSVVSKGIDFVVDYYNQTVRMFVAPELLKQSVGEKSYLTLNGGVGLVNNISGYYYESFDKNKPTYYIRDQGNAGFSSGFLNYNLYRSDYESEVDDLNLTQALPAGNKITAGKVQSSSQFNSSSMLSVVSDISLTGVRIGNASELIDRSYGNRVHRYYSPASGTLEIIRNGQLIYAIATRAGYGELNLADLPSGQYNAIMQVKSSSGDVISSQNIIINNSGNFNTDFSWHLFAGGNSTGYNEYTDRKRMVADGGIQVPFNEVTAGYLGGARIYDNNIFSSGLIAKYGMLSVTAKAGAGNNGFRFYEINTVTDKVSTSYKRVKNERNEKSDNRTFSLNYNLNISNALSLSAGYLYSSSSMPYYSFGDDFHNIQDDDLSYRSTKYSNKSLFANVFYNMSNGTFLYLNGNKQLDSDNYTVTLGVNIPLGGNVRFSNNSTYTQNKKITNNSTLDYSDKLSEYWGNALSLGAYLSDTKYNSLMYSISHHSDVMRGDGYIFATDAGSKVASLSANSTQVVNADGFFLTRDSWQNSAFITRSKSTDYDVSIRNMTDNSTRYFESGVDIISVPPYSKISVTSDTTSSNLIFADRRSRITDVFTLSPGSSARLDKEVMKSSSVIVTLRDSSEEFAASAKCISENCLSVSRLSKGVFRVKYYGDNFDIGTGTDICYVRDVNKDKYINATCKVAE